MKWTTWWSIALVGLIATGCADSGQEAGQKAVMSNSLKAQPVVAVSGDCTQLSGFFSELLTLTNQARQNASLGELHLSYELGQSAQTYAEDLATQNFFSHTGKDGSTLTSRLADSGYRFIAAGENLAAGQQSANSVFQGWMNSPGHRANILQSEFTEVGFGLFDATGNSDYGRYWVQNFGKPQSGSHRAEAYIPDSCGLTASADQAVQPQVAGVFVRQATRPRLPLGQGSIPIEALAASVVSSVNSNGQAESVPEPALLLGLGTLGVAMWRDRSHRR